MQHHPHTAEAIETAILRLDVPSDRIAAAALHLATPTSSAVGIDVIDRDGTWSWRGHTVQAPEQGGARAASERAATLATMRWRATEEAVDLEGWCLKPIRSGAHTLVCGSFLHRGPEILCGPGVSDPAAVAAAYLSNRITGDGVMEAGTERYFVHGDERVVWIHSSATGEDPGKDARSYDADQVAVIVSNLLGLEGVEAASIGSRFVGTTDVDYVGRFEERGTAFEVIVPCTIGTGCVIGAPHGAGAPDALAWYHQKQDHEAWYDVQQYHPVEPARFEPGWVARHEPSGTYVILRRA